MTGNSWKKARFSNAEEELLKLVEIVELEWKTEIFRLILN